MVQQSRDRPPKAPPITGWSISVDPLYQLFIGLYPSKDVVLPSQVTGTTCFDWDRTGSFIESVWSLVLANTCKLKYYIFVENFLLLFCFRSATLVLAYLMKYQRMNLIDAHSYVKQRRPLIRPNSGFWKDLVEFEKKLFHKNTVNMVESKIGGYIPAYSVYTSLMCILLW